MEIKHIMPVDNWWAVYKQENDKYTVDPIIGVMYTEEEGLRFFDTDSAGIIDAVDASNFVCVFRSKIDFQHGHLYTRTELLMHSEIFDALNLSKNDLL